MMGSIMESNTYGVLYDLVNNNKIKTGSRLDFSKEEFLDSVCTPHEELRGIKNCIAYLILETAKLRPVQVVLQKMPDCILGLGRKIVG